MLSPEVIAQIDASGRQRSSFIRAAIDHYLYVLERDRGTLAAQEMASQPLTVRVIASDGRVIAEGLVRPLVPSDVPKRS